MSSFKLNGLLRSVVESGPLRRLLETRPVSRALGHTRLYAGWERRRRQTATRWKDGFPDWSVLIEASRGLWQRARENAAGGPEILMGLSSGGYSSIATIESMLGVALTLRGARVHFLVCDEHLPICYIQQITSFPDSERFAALGPSRTQCLECFRPGLRMLQALDLPVHRHSRYGTSEELQRARTLADTVPLREIQTYEIDGIGIGEQAYAGALRYFTRGDLEGEPHGEAVLRRYFYGALLAMYETRTLLRRHALRRLCFHHGMYVPHGVYNAVARREGVPVVSWTAGYRNRTLIFSHDDTYHLTMIDEPVSNWEAMPWGPAMEMEIQSYLKSRWNGTYDWVSYQRGASQDVREIATDIGFDLSTPSVALLTNVIWDAQVHYTGNAFPDMLTWMFETIRYFGARPDLQLIIRAHPAEKRSRQQIGEEIARAFPRLPDNVYFIGPDYPANTYAIVDHCNAALIYATKAGIELTSMGIPVIVAGEAWIRNKGISMDAGSAEEYFHLLDRIPFDSRLDPAVVRRARRFAYHFFLRRMIPLPYLVADWPNMHLDLESLEDLLPGRSAGLDVICEGILEGREFVYPAERVAEAFDDRLPAAS